MNRRRLLALAAALALAPAARAARPKRIVLFCSETVPDAERSRRNVVAALADEGLVAGRDVVVEMVAVPDWTERFRLADGILARRPDLIGTVGTELTLLMQERTRDVPIVFRNVADPVAAGLVRSLAQPGGNITGESNQALVLQGKRFELLRELRPAIRRVTYVGPPGPVLELLRVQHRAQAALGLKVDEYLVSKEADFGRIPEDFGKGAVEAALFSDLDPANPHAAAVLEVLERRSIPAVFAERDVVVRGGLASLSMREEFGPSTSIMARILRGASPATLPVSLAARTHLALNTRTARAMNLRIPTTLLVRVDEVVG